MGFEVTAQVYRNLRTRLRDGGFASPGTAETSRRLVKEALSDPIATRCILFAVFDLDAGPVTIALPDPGKHFMTM